MEVLRMLHGYQFNSEWALFFPTPFSLVTLVLFVWSLGPLLHKTIRPWYVVWLRLTWGFFLLPAVLGTALLIDGRQVPSATDLGEGFSKYGLPVDENRTLEHLMYSLFALVSLYLLELMIKGQLLKPQLVYKIMPVVTLFLYGVAYMIGRTAVLPGNDH